MHSTDGCTVYSYIAATTRGHVAIEPRANPETQERDDKRVPTIPLQVGLPGLYIENGRVDVVLLKSSSQPT